jgi:uncharacterized protein
MNKEKTAHISNLIKQNIAEIDSHAQVILYGSRARGDERSDSDWDILVLTDYPVNFEKERTFRNHLFDLELETGEAFSIFVYAKAEWDSKLKITPFYRSVTKEGIRL